MKLSQALSVARHTFAAPFGPFCVVCDKALLRHEQYLCTTCVATLPRATRLLSPAAAPRNLVDATSNAVAPPGILASWYVYNPLAPQAEIIRTAKYRGLHRLAHHMGRLFARELQLMPRAADCTIGLDELDVLLPVPMHWLKYLGRGYNQADHIAAGIAEVLRLPLGDNIVAVRPHNTQTRKNRRQRMAGLKGSIAVGHPGELDGLNIALVDDLVTTGATIRECVQAIGYSGARPATVSVLTLGATIES